jgi:DNA-binding GntR family transcriptional regulator
MAGAAGQRSLREQVGDALRAALIVGDLRPGYLYSVPTLAEQFRVSATPVREAMLDLAKDGLVEPMRNKGFLVRELVESDLDEITDLRTLIEVPTVVSVATTATREQLEALRPLAVAIEEGAEAGDLIAYLDADHRFHLELLALAGNERLLEIVRHLRTNTRLYGLAELAEEGRLGTTAAEHQTLLDAMLRGDPAEVEQLIREHIGHVRGIWATGRD